MKGRYRDILASTISKQAKKYNHPGKINIEFFLEDGSELKLLGRINMSGREFARLNGRQLKNIKCDHPKPIVVIRFNDTIKNVVNDIKVECEPQVVTT